MKLPRLIKQHLFGNNKTREKEAEENHSKKEEDGIEERTVESIFQKIETELVFPYSSEPETYTFWTRRGELYDYELGAGPRKLLTFKFDSEHEVHQLRIAFPAEILARINFDHVAKQNYIRVVEERTYEAEIKIDHSLSHDHADHITVTKEPFLKNQENPSTHQ